MSVSKAPELKESKQQSQLKILIAKGKEQGYLTYAEVNDHLPNDIVDPDQIEDIVAMINDMGITVHEVAPDSDTLLESGNSVDEDAAEEAAAALANVDSEFGRTTDPVRMYMREMGAVELLSREGEIKIAKRIEGGLKQMLWSLSCYPKTIETLIDFHKKFLAEEFKLTDILTDYIDPNAPDEIIVPGAHNTDDDDDDEVVDTGPDPEEAKARFSKIEKLFNKMMKAAQKNGFSDKKTTKIREEAIDQIMELKLVPKMVERLVLQMRKLINEIRSQEKVIMTICVGKAHMPRKQAKNTRLF